MSSTCFIQSNGNTSFICRSSTLSSQSHFPGWSFSLWMSVLPSLQNTFREYEPTTLCIGMEETWDLKFLLPDRFYTFLHPLLNFRYHPSWLGIRWSYFWVWVINIIKYVVANVKIASQSFGVLLKIFYFCTGLNGSNILNLSFLYYFITKKEN